LISSVPKVIAHRGASGIAPENTHSAINKALEIGADLIEIDIHTTRDGEIVVMHDHEVSRTTDGRGLISELDVEQIRRMDAGSWFGPEFSGETVPTLDEVLATVKGKAGLCVEVKQAKPLSVLDKIRDHDLIQDVVVFDFNHPRLYTVRDLEPEIRTLALGVSGNNFDSIDHEKCTAVGASLPDVDRSLVERAHDEGLAIFVYTVDEEADMGRMVSLGVDGIITNNPHIATGLVDQ
jgi:glycerophosphoryl diester phosphodiesterase